MAGCEKKNSSNFVIERLLEKVRLQTYSRDMKSQRRWQSLKAFTTKNIMRIKYYLVIDEFAYQCIAVNVTIDIIFYFSMSI